jgi:hypothetical protein
MNSSPFHPLRCTAVAVAQGSRLTWPPAACRLVGQSLETTSSPAHPHTHEGLGEQQPPKPACACGCAELSLSSLLALRPNRKSCQEARSAHSCMTLPLKQKVFWQKFEKGRKELSYNDVGLFRTQLLRIAKMCERLPSNPCQKTSHFRGSVIPSCSGGLQLCLLGSFSCFSERRRVCFG